MTTLDLRGIAQTGRLIRATDSAYGFEQATSTEAAVRRSTWQQALELSGIWIQYSTDGSTPSDTASNSDTHFRVSSGTARPGNSSSRWSAWITLGAPLTDTAILDVAQPARTSADRGKVLAVAATDEDALALLAITADANRFILYTLGNLYIAQASATPPTKPTPAQITATTTGITATTAPGWQLTRPEATEALPNVFDVHVYGVDIDNVFGVLVGTPNRTDRYIDTGSSGGLDAEQVRDTVAAFITAGTGITVTHDDAANTLTITNTVVNTDTQLTAEQVQDMVAAFLQEGSNITLTYDDNANTLTIAASGGGGTGLSSVATDNTITGDGTSGDPLSVDYGDVARDTFAVRIAWTATSTVIESDLTGASVRVGTTGQLLSIPRSTLPNANQFVSIWIGTTDTSRIRSILTGATSLLGTGRLWNTSIVMSVGGVSGTLYTSASVPTDEHEGTLLRVTITPEDLDAFIQHVIEEKVEDWAEQGNDSRTPDTKAPGGALSGLALTGTTLTGTKFDGTSTDGITLPSGGGTGSTSVETRIGHVDSVGVNSQTFRVVALDEDFAAGNDYQLIVTDDSTGNTASTPRFSGERARAKALATSVPTTIGNSVLSILTWREDITTPATASVSRWAVVPGRTRREVFVVGQNSGDLGTLTIEVFKYPRALQGLKGDKGDQGDPGSGGVTFGSAAGEVATWAEGNNTDDIPFGKIEVGETQSTAAVRLGWDNQLDLGGTGVQTGTTGSSLTIPVSPSDADQIWVAVRVDNASDVTQIAVGGYNQLGSSGYFNSAGVSLTFNSETWIRFTTRVLDDLEQSVLDDRQVTVRITPDNLDEHIDRRAEEEVRRYRRDVPVIESISLSDSAFTTINSAGSQVALTWPSALTQTGGTGEVALDDLRALRDAGQILPYSANVTLLGSSPTVDNRENINDGDLTTFATFNGSTKTAVVCDWGRVVRRPRVHVWANGVSSFSFRGVNGNGHDAGALFNVSTVNGKTVWDAGERDLRGMFLQQSGGSPTVNIFLIYVEDTRLTEVTYDAATRQLLGLNLALPEATNSAAGLLSAADKTAYDGEPTLREAADTALSTRIDGLVTMPAAGESLLDLVASTYPRDIVFTLGTRIPGGSDPGYNAGTHSLNAAGSFSETGIPTDIVALYRVTESETVGGVQLQNRLIVGVDEEGGSRRYEGEAVRWAGQQVTLTYFQRSLNNFNEYYSDVVTTLATAGQTVAFNVEDVQAEARETIPYRRWIWHHTVATTTEHISNDDFTDATASEIFAPTQHAVADYAVASDTIRTTVRALGSASDTELPSERGVRVAIDAAVENISSPDPITLIASGAFSASYNGARAEEFTLSQALEDGWLLEWSEGTRPRSVAYILSDTIRSQTETFTTGAAVNAGPPHDRIGSVQVPITRHDNTGDVNTSLYFHRSSDTAKLYIGHGIGTNLTFRLRAFPLAGGSSSQGVGGLGGQDTYGSELIYLKSATATPTNTTKPTGIGYTGTGYSGLGSWTTVAPEAEVGFNILIIQLTRTFSGGSWHVGVGNIGQWYEGVNQQMPVRYIDFGGEFTFTRSAANQYVEIWLSADNRYSEPIQIAGRASADLLLLARQDLPVSGTSTAGPTIATTRTLLRNYPKIGVNVQLRLGTVILRQKYFEIATEDIVPLSVADQNNTRAQRMLALAVNSPFAAGPNWIDVAIIDGNTTVQRHPSGYTRRYLMNFIRANNDPDGDSARVFSFINVAEHDAGTFASGVRIEFFGVQ